MTIGVSAAGLDRIQARAEQILTDTVTITRASGVPTTDRNTLAVTTPTTTVYTGPALVTAESGDEGSGDEQPGRRVRTVTDYRARLPITAEGLAVGDTVTVDTSDDPDLDGAEFHITAVLAQSYHSTRRLRLERITEGART